MHSIPQELPVIMQTEESRDIQLVQIQRRTALRDVIGNGQTHTSGTRNTNGFHAGGHQVVLDLRTLAENPFAVGRKRFGSVAQPLQTDFAERGNAAQQLGEQIVEVIPVGNEFALERKVCSREEL